MFKNRELGKKLQYIQATYHAVTESQSKNIFLLAWKKKSTISLVKKS